MNTQFWIYGTHPVASALNNKNRTKRKLVYLQETTLKELNIESIPKEVKQKISIEKVDKSFFQKNLPIDAVHQGVGMLVEPLAPYYLNALNTEKEENQLILVLDHVTDPHNIGAILRSAAAFGVKAVITTDRHCPQESGILAKSASGALELVPLCRVSNLAKALSDLKEMGFWFVGTAESGKQSLHTINWKGKMGIIMGSEGDGMRLLTTKHCDFLIKLETASAFSTLNVSNAAAIALYTAFYYQNIDKSH